VASKSVIKPRRFEVTGHRHCGECGACLIHESIETHSCPAEPVDLEVLEVFFEEIVPRHLRGGRKELPAGFQEI